MNVELRQIKHAVAVARHGSFARAAAELQLSQSAPSRSVQALELQIGTPIFIRSAQGVLTTDVGRLFLERGQALIGMADRFEAQMLRHRAVQRGRLTVGAGPDAIESCVAQATARLVGQFPMVSVLVRSVMVADLPQPLRALDLDILVTDSSFFDGGPDIQTEALARQPTVLVCRAGHPLAARRGVTLAEAVEHPLVVAGQLPAGALEALRDAQRDCPSPLGRQRAMPAVQAASSAAARRIVLDSDALMPVPAGMAQPEVEAGVLVALLPMRAVGSQAVIVRPKSRPPSPIGDLFCDHLRQADAVHAQNGRRLVDTWFA